MIENHLVVMAGGVGSRFWPMSTVERPKQFLDIMGVGRSMLQLTVDRFAGIIKPENVWVVTGSRFAGIVREQLPEIPEDHILQEPCGRGTAPCVCYVSWRIKMQNPRANVVVSPADHDIKDVETFRNVVKEALAFSAETDSIVTLGIKPSRPATGYGYIRADLSYPALRHKSMFRVDAFKEKPNRETAVKYVQQNNYYWNSGIFVWSVSTIVNAFRIYAREICEIFESLQPVYGTDKEQERINEVFPSCPNISVDYAIMEKAEEVFVYPADFGWSDLGTWGSLRDQLQHDEYGNAVVGNDVKVVETHNCIIHTSTDKKVVVQGLEDCIVVESDGNILICKLSEEQRIKSFM